MPDGSTAVATRTAAHPLVQLKQYVEQRQTELLAALPGHITPDKFQRTLLTAVQENPDLLRLERRSLWNACLKAASDGVLPDKREGVILPFKESKKVEGKGWQTQWLAVYIPMVFGIRKKILQSGEVVALETGVVYAKEVENGFFYYEVGKFPPLGHRPMLDLSMEDAADDKIVGAYSIATMKDGTKSYEFMRRFELDKVQNTSQTGAFIGRDGKRREPKGPWKDWYPEMAKKTVLRRHSKTLPMSTDLIIEKEGVDAEVAARVSAVLASTREDEPVFLTDETDGSEYDSETGEIVSTAGEQVTGDNTSEERVAEKGESEHEEPQGEQSDTPELFNSDDGDNRAAQEEEANRLLGEMSEAGNVVALKKVYDGNQLELAGLPEDLATAVEGGYERNLKRLGTTRAKVASVIAKQNAGELAQ